MTQPPSADVLIEHHGIIGNLRSAALVNVQGAIDFCCFPEFDSPTVFAEILDREKGGVFSLRPESAGFVTKQIYLPETNVLVTRFLFADATVELTDFMPVGDGDVPHCILRRVAVLDGSARIRLECRPGFDYARVAHYAVVERGAVVLTPVSGERPPLCLRASIPLEVKGERVTSSFLLGGGERAYFLLGGADLHPPPGELAAFVEGSLAATCRYWRAWAGQSTYRGRWRELVTRSALVLKLLTSAKNGSLIAAATFGLPECLGGERNWDYRYTWVRDASFTLYALSRLGYADEGRSFRHWIKDRIRLDGLDGKEGPLQTMYGIDGRTDLEEISLDHLAGYAGSKPVRIGNDASNQLQLDIYGELFDAAYLSSKYGDGVAHQAWERMKDILRWLAQHWRDPDEGLWEVRGGRKEFLHSRLMCWVAFDRAVRLADKRSLAGPLDWMVEARDAIVHDIHTSFWNEERGTFVQFKVDASTLLMPLMRFISPSDPRWVSTLETIERELTVDTMVKRYLPETGVDGLAGKEGTFTPCSFWFVEALARSGRVERAHELFEKLVSHANHLGLYSEELAANGRHLGNFPQALTHLALISAATYLDRALSGARHEPWS
jgi:GH15 family glucan-1,4-alpha-glucosidase